MQFPLNRHPGKLDLRFWLPIAALIIAASACSLPFRLSLHTPTASPLPTKTLAPASSSATSSPLPTPSPTIEALHPDVLEQMEEIENQVIRLRGLHPTSATHRELLTAGEMQHEVLEQLSQDYSPEEAADEARVLALLGFLDPGYDLWSLYQDLFAEQVLGFYDDVSERMSVLSDADFDILERLTYAHEYAHALLDQSYDFQDVLGYDDAACEANGDRCIAIQSLLEGDAMLLQSQWLRTYASAADIGALLGLSATLESPVFSTAPEYVQQSMLFPYEQGASFVLHFYLRGQWSAVDGIYRNPPASTEQLLHPERYPDNVPIILELPGLEGALSPKWREIARSTLGEWQLRLFLSQFLAEDVARLAADGWGGDEYIALHNGTLDQGAIVLVSAWETDSDATQFYNAMRDYGNARFTDAEFSWEFMSWETDEVYVSLVRSTLQVMWIIAPDAATEDALRSAITIPMQQR